MKKIIIAGDFAPLEVNEKLFKESGMEGLFKDGLYNYLKNTDGIIFNLEVPLTNEKNKFIKCGVNIKGNPDVINIINELNPLVVGLANNHILDYGEKGLEDTIKLLEKSKIDYIGVKNLNGKIQKYKILEKENKKIGIYACAEHEFSILTERGNGAIPYDPIDILEDINELKQISDYIIVLYHGGKEEYRYPSPNLQKNCRHIINCGANLVLVQHNHCIACAEEYNKGTIVYGQGNFLFSLDNNEYWNSSLLLELIFSEEITLNYVPISNENNYAKLLNGEKKEQILKKFFERSILIKDNEKIKIEYNNYIQKIKNNYLKILIGNNKVTRAINKFLNYKLINFFFSRKGYLNLLNYIECESHREILIDILKEEIKNKKNDSSFFI